MDKTECLLHKKGDVLIDEWPPLPVKGGNCLRNPILLGIRR